MSSIEPWMRGPMVGVHPMVQPFLFSFQQAREDLDKWTADLTTEQLWARPFDLGPVGFHIRHAGGSVERLLAYANGGELSEQQLRELKSEMEPGATREMLFAQFESRLETAERVIRGINVGDWTAPRYVGRKRLPTTVGGLLTHIAEHLQRHVGEAIVTAKVVRGANPSSE
jgi:hypothetical protein